MDHNDVVWKPCTDARDKPALMPLESAECALNLGHSARIPLKGDGLTEKTHFCVLAGAKQGVLEDRADDVQTLRSGQLPRNGSIGLTYSQRPAVASLYCAEHGRVAGVHPDADARTYVMGRSSLARYVDAPLSHEEAGELAVERSESHGMNHTAQGA